MNQEKYYFGPSRLLTKRIRLKSSNGKFDFNITSGNQSQPIIITSVVWNSSAYLQGMRPGDQILSINGIQLNYTQALQVRNPLEYLRENEFILMKMLHSMKEIDLIIRTLRVNCLDASLYEWFNPIEQRSTSPPPSTYLSTDAILPYPTKTVCDSL